MKIPLDISHPHLIDEWHHSNTIKMSDVSFGSHKEVFWHCKNDRNHVWRSQINSRAGTPKSGCPYCCGKKVDVKNCLANTHPELAEQWHSSNLLTPQEVTHGSTLKIKWHCSDGHVWDSTIGNRVRGRGCPYCDGKQICETNCLAVTHPELAKQWHPDNTLKAAEVTAGSNKSVLWICENDLRHIWTATICNRTGNESGCPYCYRRKVDQTNCLATTHPKLVKQWHPDNDLKPTEVTAGSNKQIKWVCETDARHVWIVGIYMRTRQNGKQTGCPICAGMTADATNCLATTHPRLAEQWHYDNTIKPTEIVAGSNKKVLWICQNDSRHVWSASINSRVKGSGCAVCCGRKTDQTNCLATTHPKLVKQWHPDNDLKPTEVTAGSKKTIIWECDNGHIWKSSICNRAGLQSGCPHCSKVISKCGSEWLDSLSVPLREHWIKIAGNKKYRVDGYDPATNTVYEFLGDFWHGNPLVFSDPFAWNPVSKKQMCHLYEKTKEKERNIRNSGYNYVAIWESEWNMSRKVSKCEQQ